MLYQVTIQLADGTQFSFECEARSQYRAETAAMLELRRTNSQPVQSIQTTSI